MTPEREAEIRAVLNGDLSVGMDAALPIMSKAADDLLDEVDRLRAGIERDAAVATKALREVADAVPVDLWCTYGMVARVHVEEFQKWLRERADRIEREAGESDG